MTSWPKVLSTFFLSAGVLGLLLLANRHGTGDQVTVVVCSVGLIVGVAVTTARLVNLRRAARGHRAAFPRGPVFEPEDPRRARAWAVVAVVGALVVIVADSLRENRTVEITLVVVGVAAYFLSTWQLWRAPSREMTPQA